MSETRCPNCGKQNPADAIICWNCQARLSPLEETPPSSGQPEGTPDWLESLRGSSAESSPWVESSSPAEEPSAAEPGEEPDWLARIRGQSRAEAGGQTAGEDWLQKSGEDSPAAGESTPDWLKDLQKAGEETSPTPPAAEKFEWLPGSTTQDDLPASTDDWLSQLRASQTGQEESPADGQPEEPATPSAGADWLAGLTAWQTMENKDAVSDQEAPPEETRSGVESSPVVDGSEPGTAAGLEVQPDEAPPAEIEPAAAEKIVPVWVNELGADVPSPGGLEEAPSETPPAEETPSAPETPAEPAAALPVWLSELPSGPEEGEADTDQKPGWLSELPGDEEGVEQAPSPGETVEGPSEQLSAEETGAALWNSSPVEGASPGPFAGEGEAETPAEAETPEWLKDLSAEASAPPAGSTPFSDEELPAWLGQDGEDTSGKEVPPSESEEALEAAQLPGWLVSIRPLETVLPEQSPQTALEGDRGIERTGPLAGMVGALPGQNLIPTVRKPPVYSPNLQVSEKQRQNANLIEEILSEESRPQPLRPERSRAPQRIARVVIGLLLIAVLLLPMIPGTRIMPLPNLFPPNMVAFHNVVQVLPEGAPVLLAVDYEPGLSGELSLAAAPAIQQLITRKARLAVLSTIPVGPVLAENLLKPARAANLPLVNLGFLPGGTAGLQEFAQRPQLALPYSIDGQDAWADPALQGVTSLSQFSALIVLTENAETARSWIEQVQPALGATPLLFVVSAQAAPMIQPYLDSGQVTGLVSGLAGGTMYAQISQQPSAGVSFWDSYQLGLLLAVVLVLLGALVQLLTRSPRRPAQRRA